MIRLDKVQREQPWRGRIAMICGGIVVGWARVFVFCPGKETLVRQAPNTVSSGHESSLAPLGPA